MGNLIIPNVPSSTMSPGIYINVELGRALPSAAGSPKMVLLVGTNSIDSEFQSNVVATNKLVRISRVTSKELDAPEKDDRSAEGLFAPMPLDSDEQKQPVPESAHLYWMAKAAFDANPFVNLYAVRVTDTAEFEALFKTDSLISNQRFDYIVTDIDGYLAQTPDSDDQTKAIAIRDYLTSMAHPSFGIRQQGIIGSIAKQAPGNDPVSRDPRLQYVWSPQSSETDTASLNKGQRYSACMLAAGVAAARARFEATDPAYNLCNAVVRGIPTIEINDTPTKSEHNSAIIAGWTPLVSKGTSTAILRSVTSAANAAKNTFSVLDTAKVTVTDFVATDIELKMTTRYTGFKLAPDTDVPPPSRTATPSGIRKSLIEWLRDLQASGLITLVDEMAEQVLVELDEDAPGRVNFEIPEDVIEIFAVGAGNLIQIG